jgi:fatty acid desaturase
MTRAVATAPDTAGSIQFVREARAIVRDLLAPRRRRYWADAALTSVVAYTALVVYLRVPAWSIQQAVALLVSALAMYRAAVFIHEIVHRPAGAFGAFTAAWNVVCGIPLFMPSFLYGDHRGHHARNLYGTRADPEYLLLARRGRRRVVVFLALALVYPLLGFLRFLLLTPLALVSRRLDRLVWTRASSLYNMNEAYRRPWSVEARRPARWMQEIAASGWAWGVVWLVATQRLAWSTPVKVYAVLLLWMLLNQVRTLAAHRYANDAAQPLSEREQVDDTNTFAQGRWLPGLWAPLGMRYHALHHLVPTLPYHAMREAHRRLMAALPPGSPYRATLQPGLWPALTTLLRERRTP